MVTISATQEDAPWGLARISSAKPGGTTYTYDESAGEGVCAYSLDTGVDIEHPEFEGRAIWAKNFAGGSDKDGQGHGTHTAGTMASKTYGVAKKAKILAVKVLDDNGSGSNSGIIAGMEYVVKDAPQRDCPKGAVVNMSLGGGFSQAINDAAAGITGAGIFLAVAAGNDASNSAQYSPASEKSACTVGATDAKDALADFSNFGQVVDILAPGVGVLSTVPGGKTEEMDGTSMGKFNSFLLRRRRRRARKLTAHSLSPHCWSRRLPARHRREGRGSLRHHRQDRHHGRHLQRPQRHRQRPRQQRQPVNHTCLGDIMYITRLPDVS